MPPRSAPSWVTITGVAVTLASAFPAFLTGAVAVQLRSDLDLGARDIGLAVGSFFFAAALSSRVAGRLAERLGVRRAIGIGLSCTLAADVAVAVAVDSLLGLGLVLAAAGSANSLSQVSVNKMLAGRLPAERLGFGMAIKQSGMPLATLTGGAAVPLVAIDRGWRWTFAIAAVLAVVGLVLAAVSTADEAGIDQPAARAPELAPTLLRGYALMGLFGAAAAGSITTFLVTAAEASGIDPGRAGWLLSAGSALGIASRLWQGHLADRRRIVPVERVSVMLAGGGLGALVMATHTPVGYLIALAPAFGMGWAWPGLLNLSVIRRNPSAPAAATGISQTGIYIGALTGPVGAGFVAEQSITALWVAVAASLLVAGWLARRLARSLPALASEQV